MLADTDVLVVGAGQAGLAVSHELMAAGVDHVVVDRERAGAAWYLRWDSFTLVTPNHAIRLPGGAYDGDDPAGYLTREGIIAHLRRYRGSFGAPVIEHAGVEELRPTDRGFVAETEGGPVRARRVVACTGAYHRERRPAVVDDLARHVPVIGSTSYRSPESVPDGRVLVIGGGQTAGQLTEELLLAGREVVLSAGRAPAMPRRVGDRDGIDWLIDAGFFEQTAARLPTSAARLSPNPLVTGRAGGHDLNLRTLAAAGAELLGHIVGVDDGRLVVADDLAESVRAGDEGWAVICGLIAQTAERMSVPVPDLPRMPPGSVLAAPAPRLAEFSAVVVACGFRPDYRWIGIPGVVDELGLPIQHDGASTVVPGLYFAGVPWMRTRKSPLLLGVGEDAAVVAAQLAA
ncbi:putative oxidoreductase CzcO [Agromyces sp. NDB4Y10]|uniref:flavin-containing monooxygenase n=1 Tax=Agromyces sp. NDB4Y10 TaxID=1775951 RepID=UPI0007B316D0|nr:NAD(P)/FAD-dependent oxidoreductase [Agromyces sp. NDB4Y10]KZE94619.1 putative oxidoreductase CzcO [Agromyces sp. NDB4Y10]